MKRNIYEKPEITVLSVSMESVMVNVSGEVDGGGKDTRRR